jgi:hypothetical protein
VGGPQQAAIEYEVTAGAAQEGKPQTGHLLLVANGGQKFRVAVHVDVRGRVPLEKKNFLRAALLVAIAAFAFRFVAAIPDAYARRFAPFGSWVTATHGDYVSRYTIAAAWFAPFVTAVILYRRTGRRDILSGLVTGTVTGLAAGATLACLLKAADGILRTALPFDTPGVALLGWAIVGAAAGIVLQFAGAAGARILSALDTVLARLVALFRPRRA